MHTPAIDYRDVQGLVRFGYGHLPEACFLLLRVERAAAARSWLATVPISTAEELAEPPLTALQIAFTSDGLRALGVPASIVGRFSPEFLTGVSGEDSRSRRLGDVGANSPTRWQWGGPDGVPHLLVLLYAQRGGLAGLKETVTSQLPGAGLSQLRSLDAADLDGREPFGFKDGLHQPEIDWGLRRKAGAGDELAYGNIVAAGEFLLGYPNEYGLYTARPLLDGEEDPRSELPPALDFPDRHDLGRNGSYLVFRHLRQDVRGFWQYLDAQAKADPAARRAMAEAMVGRTMDGEPLVPVTSRPIPGVGPGEEDIRLNRFTFESDRDGVRCPLGAHVRRVNPRNADLPAGVRGPITRLLRILGFHREDFRTDTIASVRFHRLLRRARKFGPPLTPEEAIRERTPDGEERGLYFICLNANIGRQFEFVQNAWVQGTKFNGLTEERDPLVGGRGPILGRPVTDTFSFPQKDGARHRITGMPQLVTVRGGAYFFLPGIRAVRALASLGDRELS